MHTVRCLLCRKQLPGIPNLIRHYLCYHSKSEVVKQLILQSVESVSNKINSRISYVRQKGNTTGKTKKAPHNSKKFSPETLYLNDSVHIFCSKNDVIIGDSKNTLNFKFPLDQSRNLKENLPLKVLQNSKKNYREKKSNCRKPSTSSTTSSEASPKKISMKRTPATKNNKKLSQYYRINISKLNDHKSLNEKTGEFYICHCRGNNSKESNRMKNSHLKIFTSDTESASDTGKNTVFCMKCGNGYKNAIALREHMKVHERHCRVCDEIFPNEQSFKSHIKNHIFKVYACHYRSCQLEFPFKELLHKHLDSHVENEVLDSVLDMEEDYNVEGYNRFQGTSYQESINNILGYLTGGTDLNNYFNRHVQSIVCDICAQELLISDYENHLRNVHYVYIYQNGHTY